jgi:hypothetical protein
MKNRFINYFFGLLILSAGLASCIKDDVKELGNTGTSRVRLAEAPDNIQFFSPFSDVKTIQLITVRRDAVSQSDVYQPLTVKLTAYPDSIDVYNNANGASFEPLPDSLFTLVAGKGVTRSGNVFTVTFDPGVTAVTIPIALNGAKWDLSHTYGFYFKITDAGGKQIAADHAESFAGVAVKNKWDGIYEVTGSMTDFVNSSLQHVNVYLSSHGYDNETYELRTAGPTTCWVFDPIVYGDYIVPITSGSNLSGYGSFALGIEFDPATDKIVSVFNLYGQPAGNTRSAGLDPSGVNAYDAATKTIQIKYNMYQPSVVTTPPYLRTQWSETWKWIADR